MLPVHRALLVLLLAVGLVLPVSIVSAPLAAADDPPPTYSFQQMTEYLPVRVAGHRVSAGLLDIAGPDGQELVAYCVELVVAARAGDPMQAKASDQHPRGETGYDAHRAEVGWIVRASYPARTLDQLQAQAEAWGVTLEADLTAQVAAAATQFAIWTYTDAADLSAAEVVGHPDEVEADVVALASALAAEAAGATEQTVPATPVIDLDPTALSGLVGDTLGPLTVSTSPGATVSTHQLTGTAGPSLVDGTGAPATAATADLYVDLSSVTGPGAATVTTTASTPPVPVGALLAEVDGAEQATQTMIVADGTPVELTAEASVDWDAVFSPLPTSSFEGTPAVGMTLTAQPTGALPQPDSTRYVWLADGARVGTGEEYRLRPRDRGKRITLRAVVAKTGYVTAEATSPPSAPVSSGTAPQVELTASRQQIRKGKKVVLRWSTVEADHVRARGAWSGSRDTEGAVRIKPRKIGKHRYRLVARNEYGRTVAEVTVKVRLPAKQLRVNAPRSRYRGQDMRVRVRGLGNREHFTVRLGKKRVGSGVANRRGRATVQVETKAAPGRRTVKVVGSYRDRVGRDRLRVRATPRLRVRAAHDRIRASDPQRVTVRGLAPREPVTIIYQGRRITPAKARANKNGVYRRTFDVDVFWGRKRVVAIGAYDGRRRADSFVVVERCPGPQWVCP